MSNPEKLVTVLAVDDDPLMRGLYVAVLKKAKLVVAVAADAVEARNRLCQISADLILIDVQLNGSDGLQFARELSQRPDFGHTSIVALSATGGCKVEERARRSGCAGFIRKPINASTFAREITGFLQSACTLSGTAQTIADDTLTNLKREFIARTLSELAVLQARDDRELLSDNTLAKAAHRWAGASGVEGLPDVLPITRSLEALVKSAETERLIKIRAELARVDQQYRAELASTTAS